MPNEQQPSRLNIPADFGKLEGSERKAAPNSTRLPSVDLQESFSITLVLRRSRPLPDFDHYRKPVAEQKRPQSPDEFASRYGASREDLDKVTEFLLGHGLEVVAVNPARRTVVARGTVAKMKQTFAVDLWQWERPIVPGPDGEPRKETYRGFEGSIYVPNELQGIIVGVFGLDNRKVTKTNTDPRDPPNTTFLTAAQVAELYNYPTNSAARQTIGILAMDGYLIDKIQACFQHLNRQMPTIRDIPIAPITANTGPQTTDETTHDICVAAAFAPQADLNIYLADGTERGWVDAIGRVAHPDDLDVPCFILSCSFYISNGDDKEALTRDPDGMTTAFLDAVHEALADAAANGITVCVASGDNGTDSQVGDGRAHVQYPASDPWVLSVGGTTIGNIDGTAFDEYVWNDLAGATGGGVSDRYPTPSYQSNAHLDPRSLNNGKPGRGVPDVAANASPASAYPDLGARGTSAAAPQWAALIVLINSALNTQVGFVNPKIYQLGSTGFRDLQVIAGPRDNGFRRNARGLAEHPPGYPAAAGWDPCTGWGSPDGVALMDALR